MMKKDLHAELIGPKPKEEAKAEHEMLRADAEKTLKFTDWKPPQLVDGEWLWSASVLYEEEKQDE